MKRAKSTLESFHLLVGGKYTARLLREDEARKPGLTYPGLVADAWVDGLGVEIVPEEGAPWVARFANGDVSPNALTVGLYHPHAHKMCIVARGAGYVIDVDEPSDWAELPLVPIMGGLALEEQRLLVFWDFRRFVVVSEDGVKWCSQSVSWDGIRDVRCEHGEITADVWDAPSGKTVRAALRLEDGEVLRGSSPELSSRS